MSKELTKDSEALLCLLYKSYTEKRKQGTCKADAKKFGSEYSIQSAICPKMGLEDIIETCNELHRADFLTISVYIDGSIGLVLLSDKAIVYMENRFPKGIDEVLKFLAVLKATVPFL